MTARFCYHCCSDLTVNKKTGERVYKVWRDACGNDHPVHISCYEKMPKQITAQPKGDDIGHGRFVAFDAEKL